MDVSGVGRSGYTQLPVFKDAASVLAARPAMAELQTKAVAGSSSRAEEAAEAARSASGVDGGNLDIDL
jgi:hypothetical protein